ncbi:hypothetical protein SmJEL517_g01788 [Synchytrium microbalum]|uniref:Major facilitator superfamily (MFS) profile domain-containing protein n=1 Tax=Synchytrium microbalum TaxID=1806994 RepID=A0A507C3B9_9FUNG|nr:uncharacterized protein SmJEL517_g01788 [Synchytrium microbalum]TPX36010.1 hypothetical protein SmJEL517_g01788 [Synchytrium microbalum]
MAPIGDDEEVDLSSDLTLVSNITTLTPNGDHNGLQNEDDIQAKSMPLSTRRRPNWIPWKAKTADQKDETTIAVPIVEEVVNLDQKSLAPSTVLEGPPDGGLTGNAQVMTRKVVMYALVSLPNPTLYAAWGVVLAGFAIHVMIWGDTQSYGVWQRYYVAEGLESNPLLALIGSAQTGGVSLCAIPVAFVIQRFGYAFSVRLGATIGGLALLAASFANQYSIILLTQGFLSAVGTALCYFPGATLPAQWFDKKRGLATGIAVAGTGLGGLTKSLLIQYLLDTLGSHWTLRVIALLNFSVLMSASFLMKQRIPPSKKSSKNDWRDLKDSKVFLLCLQQFLQSCGFLVPLAYIPLFAVSLGATPQQGAFCLSMYNLSGLFGRILIGIGADMLGRFNMMLFCCTSSAIAVLSVWGTATSYANTMGFSVFNGFVQGGLVSLLPVVVAEAFGLQKLPFLFAVLNLPMLVGNFMGAPLAGIIIDKFTVNGVPNYYPAIFYAGGMTLAAAMIWILLRFQKDRQILKRV